MSYQRVHPVKKRKIKDLSPRERKAVYAVITGLIAVLVVLIILSLTTPASPPPPLPMYSGEYSDELRCLARNSVDVDDPVLNSTLKYLFLNYTDILYNTSTVFNKSFRVRENLSQVFYFKATRGEIVIVDTYGNGYYYYALFYQGKILLEGSETLGNSTYSFALDIPEEYIPATQPYIDIAVIVSSNSSRPVDGFITLSKRSPEKIDTVLRRAGIEYSVLLIYTWMRNTFNITDIPPAEIIQENWSVIDVLEDNATVIDSFRASLLFKKLLDILGIESHVVAVDLDGDGNADHFAIALKYSTENPSLYVSKLTNILEGMNINYGGDDENINIKYLRYGGCTWIIIDPLYGDNYLPGTIKADNYQLLGMII